MRNTLAILFLSIASAFGAATVMVDSTTHVITFPLDFAAANGLGSGSGGESNTVSNLGTGWKMFANKSGVDLRFNTLSNAFELLSTSNNNVITFGLSAAALSGFSGTSNQVNTVQTGLATTSNRVETVNTAKQDHTSNLDSWSALAPSAKQDALGFTPARANRLISTTAPLAGGGDLSADRTLTIPSSSDGVDGYLTGSDHTAFNAKVATTRSISTTAPLSGGGDLSANRTLSIPASSDGVDGYLTGSDHTVFAAKQDALGFTAVPNTRTITTTTPITGGGALSANRTFAIPASSDSTDGYLSGADHATFNAKLSLSSIGATVQAWDADLDAVAGLATTGIIRRTGAGAFSAGTLVNLTSEVTGVLPVVNFTTGTPNGSKFVRDDGVLASVEGSSLTNMQGSGFDATYGRRYIRNWDASVGKIEASGASMATVAWIGDSWVSANNANGLQNSLQRSLGFGGDGFVTFADSAVFVAPPLSPLTFSGTWSRSIQPIASANLGGASSSDTATPASVSLPSVVNAFVIHYLIQTNGGSFTYAVDGGSATTVNTSLTASATPIPSFVTVGSLSSVQHTLKLTVTVAGTAGVTIAGVDCQFGTVGARLHRLGYAGSSASNWVQGVSSPAVQYTNILAQLAPKLIIVEFGINDLRLGDSISNYKTNMLFLANLFRSYDTNIDILVWCDGPSTNIVDNSAWSAGLQAIASSNNFAFFDSQKILGQYTNAVAMGTIDSSDRHPSTAGGRVLSSSLMQLLMDRDKIGESQVNVAGTSSISITPQGVGRTLSHLFQDAVNSVMIGGSSGFNNTNAGNVFVGNLSAYGNGTTESSSNDIKMTFLGASSTRTASSSGDLLDSTGLGWNSKVTKSHQVVLGSDTTTEILSTGGIKIGSSAGFTVNQTGGVLAQTITNANATISTLALHDGSKVIGSLANGGSTTVVIGTTPPTMGQVNLSTMVTGVLPVANFATGTPTGSKFVRDDGVLAVPPGGSGGSATNALGTILWNGASIGTGVTNLNIINGYSVVLNPGGSGTVDFDVGDTPRVTYRSSTVVNDTSSSTASNVVSFSVPANALGTNRSVEVEILGDLLQNSGSATNLTITFQYGATVMWSSTVAPAASANRRPFKFNLVLFAANSTSAQIINGTVIVFQGGAAATGTGPLQIAPATPIEAIPRGTATEDSTAAKTFLMTITWASAASTCEFKVEHVTATLK